MLHKSPAARVRRAGGQGPAKTEWGSGASMPALLRAVALGGVNRSTREEEGVSAACQNHQLGLWGEMGTREAQNTQISLMGEISVSASLTHPQWNPKQGGNSIPHTHTYTYTCNTHTQMWFFSFLMFIFHYKSNKISLKTMRKYGNTEN